MQFNLFDIILLLVITLIGAQFWRIRAISEHVKVYLEQYCHKHGLQLISVARSKTRPMRGKSFIDWKTEFTFEFSSTGEERYFGHVCMHGLKLADIQLPAYRMNDI